MFVKMCNTINTVRTQFSNILVFKRQSLATSEPKSSFCKLHFCKDIKNLGCKKVVTYMSSSFSII